MSAENSFWGTCEVQISAVGWLRAFLCGSSSVKQRHGGSFVQNKLFSPPPPVLSLFLCRFRFTGYNSRSPSTVTVAGSHLELDFCLSKQLQVLIHVQVSISLCFNESRHKGERKGPSWKKDQQHVCTCFILRAAFWNHLIRASLFDAQTKVENKWATLSVQGFLWGCDTEPAKGKTASSLPTDPQQ